MPLKKHVENLDEVPEDHRALYIPKGNGYSLDLEETNLEQVLASEATSAHLTNLINSWGGNADLLAIHLKDRVQAVIDPSTGRTVMNYYSAQGNPQSLQEFEKSVKGNGKYARLLGNSFAGGAGVPQPTSRPQQRSINFHGDGRLERAREFLNKGK
ncbi:hypothetical protein P3911_004477 [Salmonella enterica]|nr:hypothetical protein [Salmonella enterica]